MPNDILILGGVAFDDYSTPALMMGGGNQAMAVHKLPGGARVIDTLGPDEADIHWHGQFFGDDAYATALQLDAMRAGGQLQDLTWGGQFRSVIIKTFIYEVKRLPVWVFYRIVCTVYQNPQLGVLGFSNQGIDSLVLSDLEFAIGL